MGLYDTPNPFSADEIRRLVFENLRRDSPAIYPVIEQVYAAAPDAVNAIFQRKADTDHRLVLDAIADALAEKGVMVERPARRENPAVRHHGYRQQRGLSASDIRDAMECYNEEVAPAIMDGTYDGPAICMLSTGYAEVFADGDVVQHGHVVYTLDVDF